MTAPPEALFPPAIDSTMIATYVACPHKFFLENCLGLAPTGLSIDLACGAATSAGMEAYRRRAYGPGATTHEDALAVALIAALRAYGDNPFDNHPKSLINTLLGLDEYFDAFGTGPFPPHSDELAPARLADNQPSVEFTFAFPTAVRHPTTGDPVLYAGRFDMIGADPEGRLWGVDEKTMSQMRTDWAARWPLRGQFLGYTFAARESSFPLVGFRIRGIAFGASGRRFAEAIITPPPYLLNRWWQNTQRTIARMVEDFHDFLDAERAGFFDPGAAGFPRAFGHPCNDFGGCAFREPCMARDPSAWYGAYAQRRWSPLRGATS